MDSTIFSTALLIVVAVVMLGLGLELTGSDFWQVATAPRAMFAVLGCQIVLLPLLGVLLLVALEPPATTALGVVVLLASPGGAMAAVFSHLAGGDVALNISATAVNAVLALVTMPVVIGAAVQFLGIGGAGGLVVPSDKVVQVVLVVLVPAGVGMLVRRHRPAVAARLRRPVRVISIIVVVASILTAVVPQAADFARGLVALGALALALNLLSLGVGYLIPRLLRLDRRQATASALEIGIHNVALAITVCVTVLGDPRAAVFPAMYGALMFGPAVAFAWLLSRQVRQ